MKIISNEKWEEYKELKNRNWKYIEKIRKEDLVTQRRFQDECHYCKHDFYIQMEQLRNCNDDEMKILNIQIEKQRKTITKQHIDIDKLQKLLKRKKK